MTRQIAPPKQCEACEGMRRGFPYTVYRKSHRKHWSIADKRGKCLRKLRCRRRPKATMLLSIQFRVQRAPFPAIPDSVFKLTAILRQSLDDDIRASRDISVVRMFNKHEFSDFISVCHDVLPPTQQTNSFHRISSGQRDKDFDGCGGKPEKACRTSHVWLGCHGLFDYPKEGAKLAKGCEGIFRILSTRRTDRGLFSIADKKGKMPSQASQPSPHISKYSNTTVRFRHNGFPMSVIPSVGDMALQCGKCSHGP